MLELFKTIMANPLHGVVAALCIVVFTTHSGLTNVEKVQAENAVKQVTNDKVNTLVFDMNNTIIRMDENIQDMKEDIKTLTERKQ